MAGKDEKPEGGGGFLGRMRDAIFEKDPQAGGDSPQVHAASAYVLPANGGGQAGSSDEITEKYFALFSQALANGEGADYYKLQELLTNLAPVVADEKARYGAAIISMVTSGKTINQLVAEHEASLAMLENELSAAVTDLDESTKEAIGSKQEEHSAVVQEIKNLNGQLEKAQAREKELTEEIGVKTTALERLKGSLTAAYEKLKGQIEKQLANIHKHCEQQGGK